MSKVSQTFDIARGGAGAEGEGRAAVSNASSAAPQAAKHCSLVVVDGVSVVSQFGLTMVVEGGTRGERRKVNDGRVVMTKPSFCNCHVVNYLFLLLLLLLLLRVNDGGGG